MKKIILLFIIILFLISSFLIYIIFSLSNNPEKEFTNNNQEYKEEVCTLEYSPVCGKDGKTYGNKCIAQTSSVEIDYEGECAKENNEEDMGCHMLWWYDKNNKKCQEKEFCGAFMYFGLKTFEGKEACEKSLEEYINTPTQTEEEKKEILEKIGPGQVDIDTVLEIINSSLQK